MCNQSGLQFGKSHLSQSEVKDKIVIEVGSRDVNGSIREDIESLNPLSYIGVDMLEGKGVDEICDVNNLVTKYGNDKFDLVISTELMEHVREWHKAISNLKNILKPDGILLLTTRSKGFGYHGFPFDFWRYEIDDMKIIFSDFIIEAYENDTSAPGVFIKARKPTNFSEKDLNKNLSFHYKTRGFHYKKSFRCFE